MRNTRIINKRHPSPTAYNRAYLASVLRTFAQIQPNGRTSDTLGTLYEIHSAYVKIKNSDNSNEEKDVLSFIFLK